MRARAQFVGTHMGVMYTRRWVAEARFYPSAVLKSRTCQARGGHWLHGCASVRQARLLDRPGAGADVTESTLIDREDTAECVDLLSLIYKKVVVFVSEAEPGMYGRASSTWRPDHSCFLVFRSQHFSVDCTTPPLDFFITIATWVACTASGPSKLFF